MCVCMAWPLPCKQLFWMHFTGMAMLLSQGSISHPLHPSVRSGDGREGEVPAVQAGNPRNQSTRSISHQVTSRHWQQQRHRPEHHNPHLHSHRVHRCVRSLHLLGSRPVSAQGVGSNQPTNRSPAESHIGLAVGRAAALTLEELPEGHSHKTLQGRHARHCTSKQQAGDPTTSCNSSVQSAAGRQSTAGGREVKKAHRG